MRTAGVRHISRRRWLICLAVAGLLMIPPAVAWACNPQAHINLNQTSFSPGSSVTVYGSYFAGGKSITVSGPSGSTTVTSSAGGAFVTSLTAPSSAGDYVVNASKPTGGTASASFVVTAPPAPAPTPVASQPSAPSTPSTSSTGSSHAKSPAFVVPKVHRSAIVKVTTPVTHHHVAVKPNPAPVSTPAPVETPAPVVVAPTGEPTFSGSVPAAPVVSTPVASTPVASHKPAARAHHPAAKSTTPASSTTAPTGAKSSAPATSQLAATSDLWSGFAPGRTASLTSGASGGMASGGGTSSALTIGIALLAFGLIGLVTGLTGAELRRRRVTARR